MAVNIPYQIGSDTISQQKMQFHVIHRRPSYTEQERRTVQTEIANQLFEIFRKYSCEERPSRMALSNTTATEATDV